MRGRVSKNILHQSDNLYTKAILLLFYSLGAAGLYYVRNDYYFNPPLQQKHDTPLPSKKKLNSQLFNAISSFLSPPPQIVFLILYSRVATPILNPLSNILRSMY